MNRNNKNIFPELVLVFPTKEFEDRAAEYKREFFDCGEPVINGSALWDKTDAYDAWLKQIINNSDEKTVQPDWVVSSTFFGVREKDGKIVGMIDVRHHTDHPFLREYGGHIGYSIRPTERNKGYATEMLTLALDYCRGLGLKKVMLGCYKDNTASIRTIEKCGGVCEKEINYTDGKPMLVFWIEINKMKENP